MKLTLALLTTLFLTLALAPSVQGQKKKAATSGNPSAASTHQGDVSNVRVIRRLEQHPYAGKLWHPFIIQGNKPKDLVVAFGVELSGKSDMGDIVATVSTNDGDSWGEPVRVFDHRQRQGAIQFGYANPVLYRAPGQAVIWCFAMRTSIVQRNSEESGLVGAFSADGGRSWTQVELAMLYGGPLIIVAGIFESEIDGQKCFLLPAHRNTLITAMARGGKGLRIGLCLH